MRILVTGAGGAVGSQLVPRLLADGHQLRALVRRAPGDRPTAAALQGAETCLADALTGDGLAQALSEVEVAYYLIHSMRRPDPGQDDSAFPQRERVAAENFAAAAAGAGVRRVVYLGGPVVKGQVLSRHLASRKTVEDILAGAAPEIVALRASIVLGARSRSFRFMVRLIERMPVLALPPWRSHRTRPIDARDMTELLVAAASIPDAGRPLNVGGPDVLSYQEMFTRIAELMLVNRPVLALAADGGGLGARVAAALAGEDPELVTALMESLDCDLLAPDDGLAELAGVRLHDFDSAVEHALGEWEQSEPLAAR